MAFAAAEITWFQYLLKDFNLDVPALATLLCDNQAAIQIAGYPVFHERTKHIEVNCHYIREKVQTG